MNFTECSLPAVSISKRDKRAGRVVTKSTRGDEQTNISCTRDASMGLLGKHTDQIGSAMERKVASSKRWAEYISRQFVCDRFASTRNEYSSLPPVDVSMALRTRHALYGRGQMAASATTGHLECFSVDAGCIRLSCDPLLALDSRHFDSSN